MSANATMRVVLGVDGSATAQAAVQLLAALPLPGGTAVTLVTVVRAGGERGGLLEDAAAVLAGAGHTVATETRTGRPAAEILAAADRQGAHLVVVGAHGSTGFGRFSLGSVAEEVLRSARRSVLVVRAQQRGYGPPWRILLGYDGSAASDEAVGLCARLELGERDAVRLLTVLPMVTVFRQDVRQQLDEAWPQERAAARAALEGAAGRLRRGPATVTTTLVEAGDVGEAVLAAADDFAADLVVVGHKGKGAVERFLMGSTTPRVALHARCSVLVARSRAPEAR